MAKKPCPSKKTAYRDEIAAKLAMATIRHHGATRAKTPRKAYRCPDCNSWHLTSQR